MDLMMSTHLPVRPRAVLLLFCLLGLMLHWLPNWGVPLHSDTSFIFRLMAAPPENRELAGAIPPGFKAFGAYPQSPFSGFIALYRNTERFWVVDIVSFWLIAKIAGANADLWRLIPILSLSLAVGLFYLTCLELKIPRSIALLLSLSLLLAPLDIWVDYNKSESRGILFLMLALYLVLKSGRLREAILSATAMLLAVLTKETFLPAWLLIPALILYREWSRPASARPGRVRRLVRQFIPHAVAVALLAMFVVYLKISFPLASSYVSANIGKRISLFTFGLGYLRGIKPVLLNDVVLAKVALLALLVALYAWLYHRSHFRAFAKAYMRKRFLLVISILLVVIVLHAIPYYFTGRVISGRYLVPANFLGALLLGFALTSFYRVIVLPVLQHRWKFILAGLLLFLVWPSSLGSYREILLSTILLAVIAGGIGVGHFVTSLKLRKYWADYAVVAIALVIVIPHVDGILHNAAQNRVDQTAWQALIDQVAEDAPRRAHIVLNFREPYMVETAYSLEANTLLLGRYDLTYHLLIEDESAYQQDSGYLRYQVDAFNMGRLPLPAEGNGNVVYVYADREGHSRSGSVAPLSLRERISLLFRSPGNSFKTRYFSAKTPYLNYRISSATK